MIDKERSQERYLEREKSEKERDIVEKLGSRKFRNPAQKIVLTIRIFG